MRLLSLTLESFRSYPRLDLTFEEESKITVLLGENATGKTNVLEAIAVLALLTSPRKAEDHDLITWEQNFYRVKGEVESDTGERKELEVTSQVTPSKQRACFINGVRTPAKRYIGTLPLVTFTPVDLSLFTGPPTQRRQLLDVLLSQVSPSYSQAHAEYERALRQRNTLLRHIKDGLEKPRTLDVWDEKLSILGAIITRDRLQLMETIQLSILHELLLMGEKVKTAQLTYVRKGLATEETKIKEELLSALQHYRERDILTLMTSTGPHRDDWTLTMNEHEITTFASRGQQRSAVLALLLIQASFLEVRKGEKPILLLDDVFSEFDDSHRRAVLQSLAEHQVILSAVAFDPSLSAQAHVLACPLL